VQPATLAEQPARDALGDPGAGPDHDVDIDAWVAVGEALQDRRQHVAARRRRGGERERPALGLDLPPVRRARGAAGAR
jgi:hypothetical protein